MNMTRTLKLCAVLVLTSSCAERTLVPEGDDHSLGAFNTSDKGCGDLPTQPDKLRVDLYEPSFSDPLAANNPLFPVGILDRVVLLGSVEGEPLRVETTRLAGSRRITVNGEEVETIISQYVAWIDGRIQEVALDWYGQDDEGAVWYFGEDVFNYEDGVVADTEGTWLAGREGPVAMIMPADPQVENVWRPENACPLVFEEVTATATGVTVPGPQGSVFDALIVRELHMDGGFEEKTFAPGYGEFSTGAGSDLEAVAVAVPTDALPGEEPEEVETLSDGAEEIFALARNGRWRAMAEVAEEMEEAWDDYRATGVPPMLEVQMTDALDELDEAIEARDKQEARQASVKVALASLDFELRYEDREEIDRDLIEVWSRQLVIDLRAHDRGAVRGDLATIEIIRDRLTDARPILAELGSLKVAAEATDLAGAEESAAKLRGIVSQLSGS